MMPLHPVLAHGAGHPAIDVLSECMLVRIRHRNFGLPLPQASF